MMKRLLILFVLAICFCMGAMAQAVIKFDKTTHNFGTFKESQKQTHAFVFTNTGDKPLVIQQAISSCGCTVPSFSKDPIAPGKKGKIVVTYNGKGKLPGHVKRPITIQTNAANAMIRIYVEGDMVVDD